MAVNEFTVRIDCENAAFDPDPGDEIARILRKIADKVEHEALPTKSQTILDVNGNDVGRYKYTET